MYPPPVRAGQQDLEALGEARLARAVSAGDQGQAGTSDELEGLPGADPAEALDRDRLEVGARRFDWLVDDVAESPLRILRRAAAANDLSQRRRALAGREDEVRPVAARIRPVEPLVHDPEQDPVHLTPQ